MFKCAYGSTLKSLRILDGNKLIAFSISGITLTMDKFKFRLSALYDRQC